ncbi:MAG: DNA helicase RecQ [Desulfobacteraceae bacterium]
MLKTMQITCPKCKIQFDADGDLGSDGSLRTQCAHCSAAFTVHISTEIPVPDDSPEPLPFPPDEFMAQRDGALPSGPVDDPGSMSPGEILKKFFGYADFRPMQLDIIEAVADGKDAFVLMPTGSGKSICYQIPAMMRQGVGVVISPLIALMQDQVEALRQNGVRAAFLNSTLSGQEARQVEMRVSSGDIDLLYVAPERLATERCRNFLQRLQPALFAIDEAHCVSQWGHDFRPEYLGIPNITRQFEGVPKVALTATADPQTRESILANLDLGDALCFVSSFDRPNIRYRVELKNNDKRQLLAFLQREYPGAAGIVYVRTRKRADAIAQWLRDRGTEALPYHAGLDQSTRFAHQRRFLQEEAIVMVATIAFGMGIDKPDVRFVAHLDLPASVEAYYQETGRAGRDGLPADAWMIYSLSDVVAMRKMLELSEGDDEFKHIQLKKLEALLGYAETVECRRQVLLDYFGERGSAVCGNCDTCQQQVETWDGTIAAQMALSCVYRTGQRFGAVYLTDVLLGRSNERMQRFGHDKIKTFGVGREYSSQQWRSVFRQLTASGLLSVNMAQISGFRLTDKSWPVLKGERTLYLRKDPEPIKAVKQTSPKKKKRTAASELSEADLPLWEKLRALRLSISKELDIPPFVVFHDSTLAEMVEEKPTTREALLQITGVGEQKADKYGEQFLEALRSS